MLSVTGIYDGKNILPIVPLKEKRKYKVIITFVEELENSTDSENLRSFGTNNPALDFWNSPEEDIYQVFLTINKK